MVELIDLHDKLKQMMMHQWVLYNFSLHCVISSNRSIFFIVVVRHLHFSTTGYCFSAAFLIHGRLEIYDYRPYQNANTTFTK